MSGIDQEAPAESNAAPEPPLPVSDPNLAYCQRLAEEASKKLTEEATRRLTEKTSGANRGRNPASREGRVSRLKGASVERLRDDAKLQWDASIETGYTPSKWLLEQELRARKRWDAESGGFLETPCFEEDGERRDVYRIAAEQRLTGLCFSGGGIRSATFNLGVLQGLAQLGLLPFIDYLSSVSGGGYIHQFLAAWILRDRHGRAGVESKLIPQAEPGCPPRAPEPIKWLQRYASYLTPRRGLFSTDLWTMVAIWFRNTILNQVPIVAFLVAAFFLLNLLVQEPLADRVSFSQPLRDGGLQGTLWSGVAIFALVLWSLLLLARDLYRQEKLSYGTPKPQATATSASQGAGGVQEARCELTDKLLGNTKVRWLIIVPWLAMAVWAAYWPNLKFDNLPCWQCVVPWIGCALVFTVALLVAFAGGAWNAYKALNDGKAAWKRGMAGAGLTLSALLPASFACALAYCYQLGGLKLAAWIGANNWNIGSTHSIVTIDPWRIEIVLMPALLLSIPYVAIELTLGLLGRDYADARREWLARLRAWSLLYGLVWMGLTAIALLAPYLAYYIWYRGLRAEIPAIATFVISHLTTILAGSSTKSDGKPTSKGVLGYKPMDLVAIAAAPVAVISFLVVLSTSVAWSAHFLVQSPHLSDARSWVAAHGALHWLISSTESSPQGLPFFAWKPILLICAAFFALLALLFGWRLDINEFSMQSFYRNRLSRCYLGAALWEREPNPFTGFDMRTQVDAANLRGKTNPPLVRDLLPDNFIPLQKLEGTYDGPFPIFCSTLNLTTGEDLASQERKGASFSFTPLYSGYSVSWTDGGKDKKVSLNGYVPTGRYAYKDGGVHLDTAVAISGAAVNPNQGYNSNPALAFLMTFFNVRLGWWISNPRKTNAWQAEGNRPTPAFALWYLLKELFGSANDRSKYVNLSDGGHFENMGLYELVRRRCKYIIVCDAEEDPEMKFCGIGNAVNRCRSDFGAEIDLDLRPLQIQDDGFSQTHCVVGTIRYPPPQQVHGGEAGQHAGEDPKLYEGTILYIKSSLVGDEPTDLIAYKLQHDAFPQDSTANQWFQETQFESYRRLGHHIAMTAIRPALQPDQEKVQSRTEIAKLFDCMYAVWYPPTPEMQKFFTQHEQQYQSVLKELRDRPELVGLADCLNDCSACSQEPVVWTAPSSPATSEGYARQFANALLDFMYTIYADLQLAFPDNRTSPRAEWWIGLFRNWCRVSLLRETWQQMTPIYSNEFQLFARRELKLPGRDKPDSA
ncbi:MAG TPA: hypothetical protein VFB43_17480 [Terracidiphilus sp.]|nr:hypothetical protein [Terracidiphilus sp.]